jgi:pimeloyl-ACP methyl ester carboxylesterase
VLRITAQQYSEPPKTAGLEEEALVIHRRGDSSHTTHLAIFVHGLGGVRYGRKATWGDFPKMLFDEFPALDIGMYAYRTLFRRLKFWKSVSIEKEAAVLGDLLLDLCEYENFILIGHSLGGVLCKSTLVYLVNRNEQEALEKVSSLFLMATPQLGSIRLPRLVSNLSHDFQALKVHASHLEEVARVFQDRFHCSHRYPLDDKVHIPCWALIASEDFWVDGLSAGISLESSQKRNVRGTHKSLVKPRDKQADSYLHARFCVKKSLEYTRCKHLSKCEPGSSADLVLIHELAVSLFGSDVSGIELMRAWWHRNPSVFWLLRRVTRAPGTRTEQVVGFFCLIPTSKSTAAEIRSGAIKGATLSPNLVLAQSESIEALYIGGIAGVDPHAKADIMLALTTHLYSLERDPRGIIVLARPVTSIGLRIVRDYEMEPVDPRNEGIGGLYELKL